MAISNGKPTFKESGLAFRVAMAGKESELGFRGKPGSLSLLAGFPCRNFISLPSHSPPFDQFISFIDLSGRSFLTGSFLRGSSDINWLARQRFNFPFPFVLIVDCQVGTSRRLARKIGKPIIRASLGRPEGRKPSLRSIGFANQSKGWASSRRGGNHQARPHFPIEAWEVGLGEMDCHGNSNLPIN